MSHSDDATLRCLLCGAQKASLSGHWVGCSCHGCFVTRTAGQTSQQRWFTEDYRRCFPPEQTVSPFCSTLPSRCPPSGFSVCHGSKTLREAARTLFFSFSSCLFLSLQLSAMAAPTVKVPSFQVAGLLCCVFVVHVFYVPLRECHWISVPNYWKLWFVKLKKCWWAYSKQE